MWCNDIGVIEGRCRIDFLQRLNLHSKVSVVESSEIHKILKKEGKNFRPNLRFLLDTYNRYGVRLHMFWGEGMIPPLSTYSSTEPVKFNIESKNWVDKNFEGDFEHLKPNITPFFETVKGYDYMTVVKVACELLQNRLSSKVWN
jgi:hypothetical protein